MCYTVVCIFDSCNFDSEVRHFKRYTNFEYDFAIVRVEFVVLYFILLDYFCVILEKLHFYTSCLQIYLNQTLKTDIAENPSKHLRFQQDIIHDRLSIHLHIFKVIR